MIQVFVLSFEDSAHPLKHAGYFFPKVEIKNYGVLFNRQNILDQTVKNDMRTYDNIRKIETGQGNKYTTGCLVDYTNFSEHNNLIVIDLSK